MPSVFQCHWAVDHGDQDVLSNVKSTFLLTLADPILNHVVFEHLEQSIAATVFKEQKCDDTDRVGAQGWNLAVEGSSSDQLVANKTKQH